MTQGRSLPSCAVDWSSLPDELLGVISSKLASPRGRVRFAAVCSSWRAAAPPPALPLLLLSSGYEDAEKLLYCPEDDGILRVPLTHRLWDMYFSGSYDGGWVVAASKSRGCPIMILNLFSCVKVALSATQRSVECAHHPDPYLVRKVIFSEAPTSSSCVLAAMTHKCNSIALCRVGCPDGGWTRDGCEQEELGDIAFCRGELYGITRSNEDLIKYDIGENEDGAPVVISACQLNVKRRDGPVYDNRSFSDYVSYIFELRGKLAMAVMIQWSQNRRPFFKVFQLAQADADDDAQHDFKWVEVLSLGDYALFLGPAFSCRAVHVPATGRGGVERNRIYYSHYRSRYTNHDQEFHGKTYLTRTLHGDRMYCSREDGNAAGDSGDGVEQIAALGYYVREGPFVPMWFFPPGF